MIDIAIKSININNLKDIIDNCQCKKEYLIKMIPSTNYHSIIGYIMFLGLIGLLILKKKKKNFLKK